MTKEAEARRKIKSLRQFYVDSFTFVIVNTALILIWAIVDRNSTFWPKYVMIIWGLVLVFKAYRMGLIPLFSHYFSFLSPEWETRKVKELKTGYPEQRRVQLNRDRKK